jgi:cytochrome c553
MCAPCHGADGLSKLPEAPNLAGQTVLYLTKTLHDYKSGVRKNAQMSVVAPSLTDEDIADFAAYYSAIQITVKVPE